MLFTVEYCRKIKFLPDCIRPGNTFGWHKTWKLQRLELRHPSPRHCCMSPFHSRWLMWTNWTKGCHQWNTNWKLSGNLSALKHSENYNEGSLFHHFHLTYEVWFTTRWVRLEAIGSGFGVCWWIHQQDHSNLDAVFGKRRIKTLKDSIAWNNLIFSWTSSSGLCSVWGSQELDMVLRPWSYTGWGAWELWQRWLTWLPPTVLLPSRRTKKWRNLTSSLQKRKAEYHLQGTLALSACLYSMFCFWFLREVQVFCKQINAVLRSTKHIRALLFLDILNQKPPRRLAPIEVRFRLSAERFLACTSNFEPLAVWVACESGCSEVLGARSSNLILCIRSHRALTRKTCQLCHRIWMFLVRLLPWRILTDLVCPNVHCNCQRFVVTFLSGFAKVLRMTCYASISSGIC